jgi:hypothetical protein
MRTREQVMAEVWAVCRELGLGYRHALVAGVTIAQEATRAATRRPTSIGGVRSTVRTHRPSGSSTTARATTATRRAITSNSRRPAKVRGGPRRAASSATSTGPAGGWTSARRPTHSSASSPARASSSCDADPRGDGELAQAVQRSRYPDRYERHAPYVREVLDRVLAGSPSSPAPTNSGGSTVPPDI